jgi:hypothetical protein
MIVTVNVDCYRQPESDVLSAVSARWEGVVVHTSDLVSVFVSAIMDYIANTGIGYFSPGLNVSPMLAINRCSFPRKNEEEGKAGELIFYRGSNLETVTNGTQGCDPFTGLTVGTHQ